MTNYFKDMPPSPAYAAALIIDRIFTNGLVATKDTVKFISAICKTDIAADSFYTKELIAKLRMRMIIMHIEGSDVYLISDRPASYKALMDLHSEGKMDSVLFHKYEDIYLNAGDVVAPMKVLEDAFVGTVPSMHVVTFTTDEFIKKVNRTPSELGIVAGNFYMFSKGYILAVDSAGTIIISNYNGADNA